MKGVAGDERSPQHKARVCPRDSVPRALGRIGYQAYVRAHCGLSRARVTTQPVLEFFVWSYSLATSIESIVSAYVRLKNRQALENMRDLRRQLLEQLQSTSGVTRLTLEML